jgi:ABC-type glycerol-3-phosphate transport system substrate-binding protein
MQSLRLLLLARAALAAGVLSVCLCGCSSSGSSNGALDNGTFTVPAVVTVDAGFSATYVAKNARAYPDIKVLPVSTDYIADGDAGLKALRTGSPALYAISNGQVLDYVTVEVVEPAK